MSMTTDNDAPAAGLVEALTALKRADQFISNGIEFGFIRMPDTNFDPAHATPDIIRAAIANLSAALQAPQEAGESVKALEWYPDPMSFPHPVWGAQSSFGRYTIEEVSASDSPAYEVRYTPHHLVAVEDNLASAKAAAQSDYEKRIRSALSQPVATPAPSQDAAVVEQARNVFAGSDDADTELMAAAREAGWALMEIVDGIDWTKRNQVSAIIERLGKTLAATRPAPSQDAAVKARVTVPAGQTPLNDKLGHVYLDVFNEGVAARDSGKHSPYHGHSLEHCLHAAGWVQRDLRLALDAAKAAATRPAEAQAVAEGWKLVPVDPTMTMLNAAIDTDPHKLGDISPLGFRMSPQSMFERAWRSMLAASPATGGA